VRVYARGKVWWLQCSVRGKEYRVSLHADIQRTTKHKAMELATAQYAAIVKGIPHAFHRCLCDAHSRYVLVTHDELRRMKSPLVYAYIADGTFLYIGMSKEGLTRPLDGSHHLLAGLPITEDITLMYFPVETAEEVSVLEARLIQLLKPKWNDGGKPQAAVSDEDLRTAVALLTQYRARDE